MDRPIINNSAGCIASGDKANNVTSPTAKPEASPTRRGTGAWQASLTAAAKRLATNLDELARIEARSF